MGTIRLFKVWLLISLMVLSGGSLAFAQWSDCGVNTCTNDNVGIGTTSPGHKLEAGGLTNGGIAFTASAVQINSKGSLPNGRIYYNTDLYIDPPSGKNTIFEAGSIGVGASPNINGFDRASTLRSGSDATANRIQALEISGTALGATDTVGIIRFLGNAGSTNLASIDVLQDGTTNSGSINFQVWSAGVNKEVMRLKSTGNVGIGTTSPSSKLHVAGDATIDGNIAAKYQDVAEWVRSPASLVPGTVVVIDPLENNRVLPASLPYDTRVAGVVSPQPGILLGEPGEDKVKVAHSGRVKVKADAQSSPIVVGDLLVSSPTPGYAMASKPVEVDGIAMHRPGTIVGKALEPLKEGQGEILVLLTLQ